MWLGPEGVRPQDSTVVYMLQCVCVCICPREMYSCLVVQFHTNSSQLFKIITECHQEDTLAHRPILTKDHIWTGLAHSTFYTNAGDKSSVIECASVRLFSSSNNLLIVLTGYQGPRRRKRDKCKRSCIS